MIRWWKERGKKFQRRIRVPSSSNWLAFLIHIHGNLRVLHILNCSLMSENVSSGWGPILFQKEEESNTRKEVLILFNSKVSTAQWKKPQLMNTCTLCSLRNYLGVATSWHSNVCFAIFQERPVSMVLRQKLKFRICNVHKCTRNKHWNKDLRLGNTLDWFGSLATIFLKV